MATTASEPSVVVVLNPADPRAVAVERVATYSDVPLNERTATLLAVHPGRPIGAPCPECCHWILPVSGARPDRVRSLDGRKGTQFNIQMSYEEWLGYHLHVVTHQGLDRRMQVNVA